ncbi:SAM-dependent methyltransferase [Streptomyces radicis]|uniref:SAM-dependent methyltransferase n=1 Tax=Streptomyces radicis TaxID=1750517 RepID=A0A3A9WD21_9ACTN|nr:SAM-dependent methyltransferase [Streptomyces radicis]RKN10670.1 SAM-dependent methyltransferase [Streptomyces radicis]RKN24867.1 SAM-dependent methyltransferase [Streptomyces radicis]
MAEAREEAPPEINVNVPSVARIYDYALGGKDNYAVDRAAYAELEKAAPSSRPLAINNRRFLQRVVRILAEDYGIRQFIDHGSGLPTQDNVHQVSQRIDPSSRVVYIDNDPIVLAHGRALLQENDKTAVIQADFRDTDAIFAHPDVQRLIDFDEPVGALFVSVLHCIPDSSDPWDVIRRVVDQLPSGSFLVINQLVSDDAETRKRLTDFLVESTGGNWGRLREPHEVERYFEGLEILDPGLVEISTWRPDSELGPKQKTDEWIEFGGVARKP